MSAFALPRLPPSATAIINVTPLVDVMLVLLVICMLAVPLATQRLPLRNAACGRDCPAAPAPAHLSVKRTGEMYWDGRAINRGELHANLGALARDPERALEIEVEANARYALFADALAAARNAGVLRVTIAPRR
jgi:biopolymer transport protein ExbD